MRIKEVIIQGNGFSLRKETMRIDSFVKRKTLLKKIDLRLLANDITNAQTDNADNNSKYNDLPRG